jgi:hypothetical protein
MSKPSDYNGISDINIMKSKEKFSEVSQNVPSTLHSNATTSSTNQDAQYSVDNDKDITSLTIPEDESFVSSPRKQPNSTYAHLVRGWENYLSIHEGIPFQPLHQPLQMLQDLAFCGPTSPSFSLLSGGYQGDAGLYHSLAPPALRHTHSNPNTYRPPMVQFDEQGNSSHVEAGVPPPPVLLDPFQRSSSTPSAFRKHTATNCSFGTANSSAFTLPPQRLSYSGESFVNSVARYSAFDPVKYYARALEDMERTSIEVTDVTPSSFLDVSNDPEADPIDETLGVSCEYSSKATTIPTKRGAAFRAARFLSDVRVLRRKRRARNGRENPAQPLASDMAETELKPEDKQCSSPRKLETAVTVFTEINHESATESRSSELSAIIKGSGARSLGEGGNGSTLKSSSDSQTHDNDDCQNNSHSNNNEYQQLDSDIDEEDDLYRRIDSQLNVESPNTIPSPSYQNFADDPSLISPNEGISSSIVHDYLVGSSANKSSEIAPTRSRLHETLEKSGTASPTPMDCCEVSNLTPRSNESSTISPGTTRSVCTGSSSGHATSISLGTNPQSGLSTISETDREVMETNKEAKRRKGLDRLTSRRKTDNDGTSCNSSSTDSTNPHGYLALAGSPTSLREGANVPTDRFFTQSPSFSSSNPNEGFIRSNTMSTGSRISGETTSPTVTLESATNTSSLSSHHEQPPTFVSYLDREFQSDLTTFREAIEPSSERSTNDEREASPAPSEMLFGYPLDMQGNKKFQARPPRSPSKVLRPLKTPPPRMSESPVYQQLSPPRTIVDHPDTSISRPYVRRSGISSFPHQMLSSVAFNSFGMSEDTKRHDESTYVGNQVYLKDQTYEERSIEIMTSDLLEENIFKIVTPEKEL